MKNKEKQQQQQGSSFIFRTVYMDDIGTKKLLLQTNFQSSANLGICVNH